MMRTYQQLTYEQRCQISALKKSGCSQRKIAETIGTTQPTVSRELARNTGARGYRHKQAQERTEQRRAEASEPTKMTPDMITVIESNLRVEWSALFRLELHRLSTTQAHHSEQYAIRYKYRINKRAIVSRSCYGYEAQGLKRPRVAVRSR